jgi:hypothetical protein
VRGHRRWRAVAFDGGEWAPVSCDVLKEVMQYEADEGEVRGKFTRREKGSEVRLTERQQWRPWQPRFRRCSGRLEWTWGHRDAVRADEEENA